MDGSFLYLAPPHLQAKQPPSTPPWPGLGPLLPGCLTTLPRPQLCADHQGINDVVVIDLLVYVCDMGLLLLLAWHLLDQLPAALRDLRPRRSCFGGERMVHYSLLFPAPRMAHSHTVNLCLLPRLLLPPPCTAAAPLPPYLLAMHCPPLRLSIFLRHLQCLSTPFVPASPNHLRCRRCCSSPPPSLPPASPAAASASATAATAPTTTRNFGAQALDVPNPG